MSSRISWIVSLRWSSAFVEEAAEEEDAIGCA
jgi:hypothetical protein